MPAKQAKPSSKSAARKTISTGRGRAKKAAAKRPRGKKVATGPGQSQHEADGSDYWVERSFGGGFGVDQFERGRFAIASHDQKFGDEVPKKSGRPRKRARVR